MRVEGGGVVVIKIWPATLLFSKGLPEGKIRNTGNMNPAFHSSSATGDGTTKGTMEEPGRS